MQLATEIINKHMPGFVALPEQAKEDSSAESEEKQVVNAPRRWRSWRDRNKLITMDLKS